MYIHFWILYNQKISTMHPVEAFIRALFAKWYIIVVIASFSVLYSTYTALRDKGIIAKAEAILLDATSQIKGAAQNCMPLITDLNLFWNCLGQPNHYSPTQEDKMMEDTLKIQQQGLSGVDPNATNRNPNATGTLRLPSSGIQNSQPPSTSSDTETSSGDSPPAVLP